MNHIAYISWNPDPNILNFGFFALKWYSLCFVLAFATSYSILKRKFSSLGKPPELIDKLTIYIAVGTLAGARLGHCLFYDFEYYRHHLLEIVLPVQFVPQFRIIGFQGLASHGGAIGIFLAMYLFNRKYQTPYLWLADQLALEVPLAGCFIRLGNLMNSEIIGKQLDAAWAFVFVREDYVPRHPAQLYEAISYLVIFFIMMAISRRSRREDGFLFGIFLVLLFTMRFIIEFCKEDQVAFEAYLPLNMGQLLSIPLIITGAVLILIKNKRILQNSDKATVQEPERVK